MKTLYAPTFLHLDNTRKMNGPVHFKLRESLSSIVGFGGAGTIGLIK